MTTRPALLSLGHQDTPAPASPGTGGGFSGKQGHFHMDLGSTRLREETLLPYKSQLTGRERRPPSGRLSAAARAFRARVQPARAPPSSQRLALRPARDDESPHLSVPYDFWPLV